MANPYRSSEGLSARPLATSDEIELRIDPLQGDLDDRITGLHSQVKRLKSKYIPFAVSQVVSLYLMEKVAQEIEAETRVQNDIISDLQMALSQAGAGVKNGMRRMKKATQQSSNHVLHVIIFGLIIFAFVYFLSKLVRR